ncbi:unnamed protein product, partial [marine sediment metagenome]
GDFHPSAGPGPESFNAVLIRLNDDRFGSPAVDNTDIFISSETESKKLTTCLEPVAFSVSRIKEKDTYQSPPPPFITSTLQQQASTQLGFSAKKTMVIAQQLYEGVEIGGEPTALITYMRTDSPRISESALTACRNFISKHFGPDLLYETTRRYKPRKRAQEAHEAIRPTYTEKVPAEIKKHLTSNQYKLYNFIWSRFVATQMKPAHWRSRSMDIEADLPEPVEIEAVRISGEKQPVPEPKLVVRKCVFNTNERKILSKGYLTLYSPEESFLPPLTERQELHLVKLSSAQSFTQPPPRYNEASLVKTLEKYGIGRPSTYVPIISTIQARGYVKKTQRKFFATELGILVTEKLRPYFADILNTSFTAEMEEKLDGIEEARTNWLEPLREFYHLFSQDLKKADSEMTLEKGKEPPGGEKCAKCGKPLVIRWSRYGRFLACSDYPRCKNVVSQKPSTPAEVTDEVCEKCGKPMV